MKIVRDALVIAWVNGWIPAVRGWIWIIASSVSPVSFLVILSIYGGVGGLKWGLVGGFIWNLASSGIYLIGEATYYRLGVKYQSMLTAAPVSPASYAIGLALGTFIFSVPALAVYLAVMLWLGLWILTPAAVCALIGLWLASAGVGFTFASFIRHMRYAWSLPQILLAVFTVGSPVYYPATLLPSPYLGVVLPTGAASIIVQHDLGLVNYSGDLLAAAAAALAAQSVAGLYLLVKLARWRQP